MIRYSIDEVFTFPDGSVEIITVTGDDLSEWKVAEYDDYEAVNLLEEEYHSWISKTEPDGWFEKAEMVEINGYFWIDPDSEWCDEEVGIIIKETEEEE